jgi:hypothetical protein
LPQIDEQFETRVRTNNTWREIRRNADLFNVNDDDVIAFSPRDASWRIALRKYLSLPI